MLRIRILLPALFVLALIGNPALGQSDYPPGTVLAGAAEFDITPRVAEYDDLDHDGQFDIGDPTQAFGFGDRVKSFVEGNGRINVGNGRGAALYVYDPLWVHALVLRDLSSGVTVAIVTCDLYMITNADAQALRAAVDPKLGIDYILVTAIHNHMGPDTLGFSGLNDVTPGQVLKVLYTGAPAPSGINREWFERFIALSAKAIEQAAAGMQPARLTFGRTRFDFGLQDTREPLIIDDTLSVIGVDALDGRPIATLLNWACHPEAVLAYGAPSSNLDVSALTEQQREAWGRVLTADFPGYACRYMSERRGGVTLYVNGPIGGLMTNLWTHVWDPETHPEYPVDSDPAQVPAELLIPNDFRFAPLQGRELAKAALQALSQGKLGDVGTIAFQRAEVLVPMQNQVMRLAGSLGILGLNRRSLYDDDFNVDATTAPWLSGMFLPGVKVGHGRNVKTEVAVLRIGLAQIAAVPAELLPELSIGLPEDFSSNTARYFPKEAAAHPTGDKYRLAYPPLKQQMDAEFKLVFCLANDDLGYVIPRADFNPPHDIKIPPLAWWWICTDSDNEPHYEESMSISRQIEPALLGALTRLLSPELFEPKAQAPAPDQSAPASAGQPAGGSTAEEERR